MQPCRSVLLYMILLASLLVYQDNNRPPPPHSATYAHANGSKAYPGVSNDSRYCYEVPDSSLRSDRVFEEQHANHCCHHPLHVAQHLRRKGKALRGPELFCSFRVYVVSNGPWSDAPPPLPKHNGVKTSNITTRTISNGRSDTSAGRKMRKRI